MLGPVGPGPTFVQRAVGELIPCCQLGPEVRRYGLRPADLDLAATQRALEETVTNAWTGLASARATVESAREQVEAAELAYEGVRLEQVRASEGDHGADVSKRTPGAAARPRPARSSCANPALASPHRAVVPAEWGLVGA